MTALLSATQRENFIRDGYVQVSGLIEPTIIESTREALCETLGFSLHEPATWPEQERLLPLDVEVIELTRPCRSDKLTQASRELVGDMLWPGHCMSPVLENIGQPCDTDGFIPVLAFPRPGPPEFDAAQVGGWHVDGMRFSSLWPGDMLLVQFVYLTDTPPHGGATVVRPGSHRQLFAHWQAAGREPAWQEIVPDLPFAAPLPLAGAAGDVLLLHHLLVHAGSPNRAAQPRIALNANVTRRPGTVYQPKSGPPTPDWTPLDLSLYSGRGGAPGAPA